MSGHSKWHSIKHKKGAADAKRGKIFTRHANLITLAARQGGEPETNPSLRLAIDNAKQDNVPNANIERAIRRGTGEDKDAAEIHEVSYEGYGPCGVAVIVECLTDNKNRSYTNVRTLFGKRGGNLGNSGSVAWMFERKGLIQVNAEGRDPEELELAAIEAGAQDVEMEEGVLMIATSPSELMQVNGKLKSQGIASEKAELILTPTTPAPLGDPEQAKQVMEFIDALEDDEDVSRVYSNANIPPEILERLMGE